MTKQRPMKIVLLDTVSESRMLDLRALLPEGFSLQQATTRGDPHLQELISDADFAITGQVAVSADVLRAAKRLKLLHKWGVGVDNIDLETARALGICVARTTGSNALAVAEYTIGMMFAALRCSAYGHHQLKQGIWAGPSLLPVPTLLLSSKTVGIIGLGAIGQKLAKMLKAFDCDVLYTKPTQLSADEEKTLGVRHVDFDELFATSDIVSLHCPLTPQTAGLINSHALGRMKSTAVLINVARGGVVVEADLLEALRTRVIQAAAMDVFETEPLPADSPLLALDNLVVSPHLAGVTTDTFEPTARRMFANIAKAARGEELPASDVVIE
jgi:phosphoglycerate dehydrogenase-like enzyme